MTDFTILGGSVPASSPVAIMSQGIGYPLRDVDASAGGSAQSALLTTLTNTSASDFQYSSIPQTWNHLLIKGWVKSSDITLADDCHIFFNNDTSAANYLTNTFYSKNGISTMQELQGEPQVGEIVGASGSIAANNYSFVHIEILGYSTASLQKGANCHSIAYQSTTQGAYKSTYVMHETLESAITQINIRTDNHPTHQLTGKLFIYGII